MCCILVESATPTQIEEHYLCLISVGLLQGKMPLNMSKVGRIWPIITAYECILHLYEWKCLCERETLWKYEYVVATSAHQVKAHMHKVYSLYFHIFSFWKVQMTLVITMFYVE